MSSELIDSFIYTCSLCSLPLKYLRGRAMIVAASACVNAHILIFLGPVYAQCACRLCAILSVHLES